MHKKKGQAVVEFMLLMVVLVPMFLYAISAINNKVFKSIEGWLGTEIGAQVRYGYSATYFGSNLDLGNISATSGTGPVQYGAKDTNMVHPLHKVKAGWAK